MSSARTGASCRRAVLTGRRSMMRTFMIAAASVAVLTLSPTAFAQKADHGTADEAKALDMFNKGEGGFLDRDLYVFCGNISDGKIVALGNPNAKQLLGTDAKALKDSTGKAYGEEIVAGEQKPEGQFTEVSYLFPRPGADKTPVPKVSLVTNAGGGLGCGVGYYK